MHRHLSRFVAVALFVTLFAALFAVPVWAGTVQGTVIYKGPVPNLPTLDMGADPQCAEKHEGDVTSTVLVLGDATDGGHTLGNVLVQVNGDLPASPADGKIVIDQVGCLYEPRVVGVQVGQTLEVRNSDGIMHNVHFLPDANDEKNLAMPPFLEKLDVTFPEAEPAFQVKCDMHPWMKAWIAVLDHPFFAVTGPDGAFSIDGLPAGTYEIVAWHEKLGTRSAELDVGEDGVVTIEFTLSR